MCQTVVSQLDRETKEFFIAWLSKTYLAELLAFRKCVYFMLITNFSNVELDRCNPLSVDHTVLSAQSYQLPHIINITRILNAVALLEKSVIAIV